MGKKDDSAAKNTTCNKPDKLSLMSESLAGLPALRSRSRQFSVSVMPSALQSEFQDNQDHTEKPCLEEIKTNKIQRV